MTECGTYVLNVDNLTGTLKDTRLCAAQAGTLLNQKIFFIANCVSF